MHAFIIIMKHKLNVELYPKVADQIVSFPPLHRPPPSVPLSLHLSGSDVGR